MIRLNYTDLCGETQERLLENSKKDVQRKYGEHMKSYAKNHALDYEMLLEEEALRNLYSYCFAFQI